MGEIPIIKTGITSEVVWYIFHDELVKQYPHTDSLYDVITNVCRDARNLSLTPEILHDLEILENILCPCQSFSDHQWQQEYYGWRCTKCGDFIPDGCEPWMPDEEDLRLAISSKK